MNDKNDAITKTIFVLFWFLFQLFYIEKLSTQDKSLDFIEDKNSR